MSVTLTTTSGVEVIRRCEAFLAQYQSQVQCVHVACAREPAVQSANESVSEVLSCHVVTFWEMYYGRVLYVFTVIPQCLNKPFKSNDSLHSC